MGVKIIKILAKDDGMRLNRWFLREYPSLSIGRLQKLLRTKQIKLDGKKVETSTKLLAGQELRIPPLDNEKAQPNDVAKLSQKDIDFMQGLIIYKDSNIIAINKPSGLAVQGGTNTSKHVDGLLDALKFDNEERPRLVHRIDKDTSGILLLARNRNYADLLTKAFREHSLEKSYLALTTGCPKNSQGEIKAKLEKVGEKSLISDDGKIALTKYSVLDNVGDKFSLILASPLTGRTHQIRAHLDFIGCPIIGDDKYFEKNARFKSKDIADKLHLHAYKIDLSSLYNKKMIICAPIPKHFSDSLEALGLYFKG